MNYIRSVEQLYATPLNVAAYNGAYKDQARFWVHILETFTTWRATPFFAFGQLEAALSQDFDIIITHLHTEIAKGQDSSRPLFLRSTAGPKCVLAVTYDKEHYRNIIDDEQWLEEGTFDVLLPLGIHFTEVPQRLASGTIKHWSAGRGKAHPAYIAACLCEGENYVEACRQYKEAAAAGNISAMIRLASLHADPPEESELNQDSSTADFWYGQAVAAAGSEAMYAIGRRYAEGWGCTKNWEKACQWYERASTLGETRSMCNLGILYSEGGFGLEKDYKKAYHWLSSAASAGSYRARNRLDNLKKAR